MRCHRLALNGPRYAQSCCFCQDAIYPGILETHPTYIAAEMKVQTRSTYLPIDTSYESSIRLSCNTKCSLEAALLPGRVLAPSPGPAVQW